MKFSLASVVAFAASALAITVTSPAQYAVVPLSQSFQVTWTSVNTDPSLVNIVLVNNAVSPSVSINLASNIATSQGSYVVSPSAISSAPPNAGYQVNLVSPVNGGILAQTNQFSLVAGTSTSSSKTSSTVVSLTTTAKATTSAAPFPIANGTVPTTARASGSGAAGASPSSFTGAASSVQITKELGLFGAAVMGLAVIFA